MRILVDEMPTIPEDCPYYKEVTSDMDYTLVKCTWLESSGHCWCQYDGTKECPYFTENKNENKA